MNPLLKEFLAESRDALESIGIILMRMEKTPDDAQLVEELFRIVHTLKGSSGLFQFPEMTRVLHAGEDLMSVLRQREISFTQLLADQLLDAMDFVALLCDEVESCGQVAATHSEQSVLLAERLRSWIVKPLTDSATNTDRPTASESVFALDDLGEVHPLDSVPEAIRSLAEGRAKEGVQLHWVRYVPDSECFFHGEDPLHLARQTPGILYGRILAREPWPNLVSLDAFRCVLEYQMLVATDLSLLVEHFRYVTEQVRVTSFDPFFPCRPSNDLGISEIHAWQVNRIPRHEQNAFCAILSAQRRALRVESEPKGCEGRLRAIALVLQHCAKAIGDESAKPKIQQALDAALVLQSGKPLLDLLHEWVGDQDLTSEESESSPESSVSPAPDDSSVSGILEPLLDSPDDTKSPVLSISDTQVESTISGLDSSFPSDHPEGTFSKSTREEGPKFGRRADDHLVSKTLKVDQEKIDRLMNLIGEMVVAKNALPYLAKRAEDHFGVRELSREIKAQHASINRIAEEMQDAIMQVRMMPVSVAFQRFPRLVRDVSRQLGKNVNLILEGEETEADKNIVESLSDPLIHMVRNSLDHGFETPEIRRALGKPPTGTLTIRASQEADHVLIEIQDDGKGIDPSLVKRKAFEKGIIDQAQLERISDREAIHLVFAAGFSTAETVSDLSGRGVGMDVVRNAVEKVHGTLALESVVGKGTLVRITLPLSMAVTKVMIIETDGQIFGIPMDVVWETVRVARDDIHQVQHQQATILRGKVLALKPLNGFLNLDAPPKPNQDDQFAVLVVRSENGSLGLIVDNFRETLDVIQKPLGSVLTGLNSYSGSALMGNGSVLMILNVREMF